MTHIHIIIGVDKKIPHARGFFPWQMCVLFTKLLRKSLCCFTYYFKPADHSVLQLIIILETSLIHIIEISSYTVTARNYIFQMD